MQLGPQILMPTMIDLDYKGRPLRVGLFHYLHSKDFPSFSPSTRHKD
jgi:hypothetical protein